MRVLRVFILAAVACMLACGAAYAEKRAALVIGNSAYRNAKPLANPANDANDMAAALKEMGFTVVMGLDLDKAGFDARLREFATLLEEADTGLLFYAGHGLQVAERNYLIPVDAKLGRERDLDFEAVSLDFILRQMEIEREGKTNIVFLDACRDNPLAQNLARSMGSRSANVGSGLAEVQAGVGTFISYSTQPKNVAYDGTGRNSPFTASLTQRLREKGRSLVAVMIAVRKDVLSLTGGRQVPWDKSALTEDFYFDAPTDARNLTKRPQEGGGESSEVLNERVRKLEDELKRKSEAAASASGAVLMQLKQRRRQLEDEARRETTRMFDIERSTYNETDTQKRMAINEELFRIRRHIMQNRSDQAELTAQIEKLEKEAGGQTAGVDGGKK